MRTQWATLPPSKFFWVHWFDMVELNIRTTSPTAFAFWWGEGWLDKCGLVSDGGIGAWHLQVKRVKMWCTVWSSTWTMSDVLSWDPWEGNIATMLISINFSTLKLAGTCSAVCFWVAVGWFLHVERSVSRVSWGLESVAPATSWKSPHWLCRKLGSPSQHPRSEKGWEDGKMGWWGDFFGRICRGEDATGTGCSRENAVEPWRECSDFFPHVNQLGLGFSKNRFQVFHVDVWSTNCMRILGLELMNEGGDDPDHEDHQC